MIFSGGLHECDAECGEQLRAFWRERGIDATVTTEPLLIEPIYEDLDMRCPHGTLWHCQPTSEQIAKWASEEPSDA